MSKLFSIGMAVLVALGGLTVPVNLAVAQQDGECLGRRAIQEKIDSGEIRQLSEAMDAAGVKGKIISSGAELCFVGGQWQYRVNVMDASGESRPVTLPAQ